MFLGYYLPFKHSVPLWEMENDYYLHNFNAMDSFGTITSMQSHRHTFGIPEMDMRHQEPFESPRSQCSGVSRRCPTKSDWKETEVLSSLDRRCQAQSAALSLWWKNALQLNIQQRRWMRPSRINRKAPPSSRFDRVYQPEKLEQFDRIFSRVWEIPVRRSHSARHVDGIAEEDLSDYVREISHPSVLAADTAANDQEAHRCVGLHELLDKATTDPNRVPSLGPFIRHFEVSGRNGRSHDFIGAQESAKPPEEYLRYCSAQSAETAPHSYPLEKVAEFKKVLHENSLHFDDVAGIREMSKSANIGSMILTGEYWGLSKEHSAIEAATTIHEQYNALENFPETGKVLADRELERR